MKKKGLDFTKKRKKKNHKRVIGEILSWCFWVFIGVFTAAVLLYVFGLRTNVIGNSMETSLYSGQEILIDRLIFEISEPEYGDVVAFVPNGNEKSHYYVRRVIAVPGQTIQIKNGYVYIDGEKFEEKGDYDKIADPGIAENPIYLDDEEYFVMGDNRNFSEDSRSGNVGIVKKSYIIGKVWFRLSHNLEELGFLK